MRTTRSVPIPAHSLFLADDEMKIVLEGELHIKEPSTGKTIVAKVGDVLNISNGAELEFNSPNKAKIFVSALKHHQTDACSESECLFSVCCQASKDGVKECSRCTERYNKT